MRAPTRAFLWPAVGMLLLAGWAVPARGAVRQRPNIILILADDMGFSDLGSFGSEIETPNLDRLAGNGLRFTQVYNTSKCFPSRACLLTGAYAQQVGMGRKPGNITNAVTLADVLRSAGYRTLMTGKHHGTQNPFTFGFDRYFGLRDGACNYFNPGSQRPGEGKPAQKRVRSWCIDDKTLKPYTPKEKDFYTTDYFTNYALGYLDQYKNEKKPFFLYLAYNAPHDPMHAWPEDIAKYRGKYKVGWKAIRDARYRRQMAMGLFGRNAPISRQEFGDWGRLTEEQKDEADLRMAVYAAMVHRMDWNIGRIIKKVEALGELDNTLIIFASDNGGSAEVVRIGQGPIGQITRWASVMKNWANVSNTPFRKYKNYSHEGGICTPVIAHWPEVITSKVTGKGKGIVRTPGHFVDFMATFVDIAGATYPAEHKGTKVAPMQGESWLPSFRGETVERRTPIYWQWSKGRAVREGRWKAVAHSDTWQLYDMVADRTELKDLASREPERTRRMAKMWEDWYGSTPAASSPPHWKKKRKKK